MFPTNLYESAQEWVLSIVYSIFVSGYIGKPVADGLYEYEIAGDPSRVYFRLGTPENYTIKEAFNFGVAPDPRLKVHAIRFAGAYVILFPDPSMAGRLFGVSASIATQPLYYHIEKAASVAVPTSYLYLYENFH